jgi:hypothetical protein
MQAAPFVAGAALLLRNLFPAATNQQVINCLVSSADRTVVPFSPVTGRNINRGMLSVLAAYNCLAAALVNCAAQQQPVADCANNDAGGQPFGLFSRFERVAYIMHVVDANKWSALDDTTEAWLPAAANDSRLCQ